VPYFTNTFNCDLFRVLGDPLVTEIYNLSPYYGVISEDVYISAELKDSLVYKTWVMRRGRYWEHVWGKKLDIVSTGSAMHPKEEYIVVGYDIVNKFIFLNATNGNIAKIIGNLAINDHSGAK
jgi:hypothetical protein